MFLFKLVAFSPGTTVRLHFSASFAAGRNQMAVSGYGTQTKTIQSIFNPFNYSSTCSSTLFFLLVRQLVIGDPLEVFKDPGRWQRASWKHHGTLNNCMEHSSHANLHWTMTCRGKSSCYDKLLEL